MAVEIYNLKRRVFLCDGYLKIQLVMKSGWDNFLCKSKISLYKNEYQIAEAPF